jgi:hypothetical protein
MRGNESMRGRRRSRRGCWGYCRSSVSIHVCTKSYYLWEVRTLHWHKLERYSYRHPSNAHPHAPFMQVLPLRSQLPKNLAHPGMATFHESTGIQTLKCVLSSIHLLYPFVGSRWYRLQAPFFVWYPLQQLVAIVGEMLLPSALSLLPFRPGLRGKVRDALSYWRLAARFEGVLEALAVDETSSGGYGKEEEAHGYGQEWKARYCS